MRATEGYGRPGRRRRRAWAADNPGNAAARAELERAILAELAGELDGARPLLDCGCGTGWLLRALADAGVEPGRLHGVDLDPRRADAARARTPGAKVEVADMTRLPYGDGMFGAVLFVVSLSSLGGHDVERALAEARRVLAAGGMLVVYELRLANPLNPATRRVGGSRLGGPGLVPVVSRTLTLLPQIGRRLGPLTPWLRPLLSRFRGLHSHRLTVRRKPDHR